ncbi:MAG: putative LPS assembly protein LptD [Bacteroidales bacterium]
MIQQQYVGDSIDFGEKNIQKNDSIVVKQDSLAATEKEKTGQFGLIGKVHYYSKDSNRFDFIDQKLFLFKDAKIEYEDITLAADYIEIDFEKSIAFAKGMPDSTGKIVGTPVFAEGSQKYEAKEIRYNYDTKKGLIKGVFTKEGEGYLHGKTIKRFPDNTINVAGGSYTTCDLPDHPHYEFRFSKSKVIPGNLIVTGPAYFVLEGLPTPLFVPFGIFPNKAGRRSGVIIPTYGESNDRGFFFENGGYYFAINDYMDLTLLGDIYSRGSWAIKPQLRYVKRYRFNGNLDFGYAKNIIGSQGDSDYNKNKTFYLRWMHSQDPKSNPSSRFNANVNIQSSNYKDFTHQYFEQTVK